MCGRRSRLLRCVTAGTFLRWFDRVLPGVGDRNRLNLQQPRRGQYTRWVQVPEGCIEVPADPLVLVGDGCAEDRGVIVGMLEGGSVRTVQAVNATEVLRVLETVDPDLITLDVDLPDMDGFKLCRGLKRRTRTHLIPVILMGRGRADARLRAFTAGADQWFDKPLMKPEYVARCWSLLRTRGLVRTLEERRQELHVRSDLVRFLVQDLSAPLATALQSVEARDHASPMHETAGTAMNELAYELRRMAAMVQDLFDIDQLERRTLTLNRVRLSLGELLLDVTEEFQRRGEAQGTPLRLQGDIDARVNVDRGLMSRVVTNLLVNAFRYSPRGQPVIIEVSQLPEQVRLSIINRGPPVSLDKRESIFHAFVRLDAHLPAHGTGLGLAFCRLALEAHGGGIAAEDAPGGGAAFVCWVPRV
jgi:two-component system sensor histidine kinase/response regulator